MKTVFMVKYDTYELRPDSDRIVTEPQKTLIRKVYLFDVSHYSDGIKFSAILDEQNILHSADWVDVEENPCIIKKEVE